MGLIRKLYYRMFGAAVQDDERHTIDHVPVRRAPAHPERHAEALKTAAIRHGKPFRTHETVARVTPPSRDLQDLDDKSRKTAPAIPATVRRDTQQGVTPINRKRGTA